MLHGLFPCCVLKSPPPGLFIPAWEALLCTCIRLILLPTVIWIEMFIVLREKTVSLANKKWSLKLFCKVQCCATFKIGYSIYSIYKTKLYKVNNTLSLSSCRSIITLNTFWPVNIHYGGCCLKLAINGRSCCKAYLTIKICVIDTLIQAHQTNKSRLNQNTKLLNSFHIWAFIELHSFKNVSSHLKQTTTTV